MTPDTPTPERPKLLPVPPERLAEIRNATAALRAATAQLGPRTPENSMSAKHYAETVTPDAVAELLAHLDAREAQIREALRKLTYPEGVLSQLDIDDQLRCRIRNQEIAATAHSLGIDLNQTR